MDPVINSHEITVEFDRFLEFDKLSPLDSLAEIRNILVESTFLGLFQNFHLQHKGQRLSEVVQISTYQLEKKAEIKAVLDRFQERTARCHILKIHELINNPSLCSFLLGSKSRDIDLTDIQKLIEKLPQENQQRPFYKQCQQLSLQQILQPSIDNQFLEVDENRPFQACLNQLSFSGYNPPPGSARLRGDFFYLLVKTLQFTDFHITACANGFFVNNSNSNFFDPSPNLSWKGPYVCLIDLLKIISPKFKLNFNEMCNSKVSQVDKIKISKPFLFYKTIPKWLKSPQEDLHRWDSLRLQKHAKESPFVSTIKDWNQLFYAYRQMPQKQFQERLNKQKFSVKLQIEFIQSAMQGSKKVVERTISPLNPAENKYQQIFVHNNLFFSTAKDFTYSFQQERGQNSSSSVSTSNVDLRNLNKLHKNPIEGLHPLYTVLVDYMGNRVMAQCVIPGILTSDQMQCCQYGSMDDGKSIGNNIQFQQPFKKLCRLFRVDDQIFFKDQAGSQFKLAGSMDVKGILGSDKRKYVVDLLRLSPRDYNYQGQKNNACVIRDQLLDLFFASKQVNNKDKDYKSLLQKAKDIIGEHKLNTALQTGASLSDIQKLKDQEAELREIAAFLRNQAIPALIKNMKEQSNFSKFADSSTISKLFHSFGVNMRYLGQVYNHPLQDKHMKIILQRVILVKALKHLFRTVMRQSPSNFLMANLTHALNCIFGRLHHLQLLQNGVQNQQMAQQPEQNKKKKNKKKHQLSQEPQLTIKHSFTQVNPYANWKPSDYWTQLKKICQARYKFILDDQIKGYKGFQLPFNKLATVRDLCLSVGLQLVKKNYDIIEKAENTDQLPFDQLSISDIIPLVKHLDLDSQDAKTFIEKGQSFFNQFKIQQSIQSFQTALQILTGLYGGLHKDIANVYTRIGLTHYRLNDFSTSIFYQTSAISLLKLIYGQDHPEVSTAYFNLGLYYYGAKQFKRALYFTQKSLFISNLIGGEAYPEPILTFMNLSTIYQSVKRHQAAINVLLQTQQRVSLIYGHHQYTNAICFQALATVHYQINDLLKALHFQEKAEQLLRTTIGTQNQRYYQAVTLLNKFKQEINSKKTTVDSDRLKKPKKKDSKEQQFRQETGPVDIQKELLLQKLKTSIANSQYNRKYGGHMGAGAYGRRR